MRKRLYLGVLLLLTLSCININAEVITLDGATELANTFFSQNVSQQKRLLKGATPQLEYAWDSNSLTQSGNTLLKSVEEDPTFYVFNNPDGEGFVIVSGDDNAHQVIGYSYESNAPAADEIPDPMKDYLLGIDSEIKWARANLTSANKNLKATEAETGGTVVKYYETATWGQRAPLNRFCYTNATETSIGITGCVPLAYAIIMKYHEWPDEGIGNLCNMYTGASITNRTYDWSKMLMSYTGTYTDEQADEAAKLIQHIGHAFQTNHSTGESTLGGSTNYLNKFFNYNFVNSALQANYTIENWQLAIEESLDNGCPIPYKSKNSGTGDSQHIFIVDGYTDNNYYHFNFGWFGNGNGWFQITAITPSTGDDYSWNESSVHEAFFNFKPNKKVTVSVAVDPESAGSVTIDGTSVSSKEVDAGASVTLQATGDNFYGWLVGNDVVSTDATYTFTANETATYTAKFVTDDNSVIIYNDYFQNEDENIKSNCYVTGFNSEAGFETSANYPLGINLTLTASCKRGYKFEGWYTVDWLTNENILLSTENPYLFEVTESDYGHLITYSFSQISPIQPTVVSSNNDMGTASYSITAETAELYPGEQITLTATPKSGYMFTGWSDGTSTISTSKTYTVAVEEGKTYTANFALSGADYTVSYNTGTFVETGMTRRSTWTYTTTDTNPVPLQITTTCGTTEVLGMYPTANRYYASTFDKDGTTGYNTVTYTLSVPEGYIITGYEMTYWLGSSSYEDQVTVSNATSTNTPTDRSDQILVATNLTEQTTSFTVSASQTGQQYIGFSSFIVSVLSTGGGEGGGEVTPTQYTVTVSAEPATAGTVAIGSATGPTEQTVDLGATVTLVASANSGYTFVNWTKGTETVSTQPSFTATITADVEYVANFTEEGNDENTLALIASAKELKNKTGIGYPIETERATLQSAIETAEANPTAAAGETLQSAIDAYYATASVQMPTTGTTYSFIIGHATKYYIYNNEGTLALASYTEGDELPDNAKFTCEISGDKYMFRTSDNKYMAYPPHATNGVATGGSQTGIETEVSDKTKFSIGKILNGGNVSATNDVLFGTLYFTGYRGSDSGNNSQYIIAKTSTGVWDAAGEAYANANYSSAISIIEVDPVITTYTASVNASPATGGTTAVKVQGSEGTGSSSVSVDAGTYVAFTATANPGYEFLNWTKDGIEISTEIPFEVPVNANITLTANFEAIPTYTVGVTYGAGGTATVSQGTVYENGTVTLTAEAVDGYRFTGWSIGAGEIISTANPYTVTVTDNVEYVANFTLSSNVPLLTFACLSDLHAQEDLITDANNIQLRESVTKTLNQIKSQENIDLIVLGGDYVSNNTLPQSSWQTTKDLLVTATRGVFKDGQKTPVIYVNGNHDYEVANYDALPKDYNAGEYYGTPMKTDIGALASEDCFYETATNSDGTPATVDLLAAYHYVVNGFDFVVLNAGKYLFASASEYKYSIESVQWCANKLAQIYATDKNKTVFFLVHIPFSDSNSLSNTNKGMNNGESAEFVTLLKSTLAQYPNLVMLYGHDHGTDSAYIREATSQRVTEYGTDGNVWTGAGSSAGSPLYSVQNYSTSTYLGYNSYNLATTATQTSDVTVATSTKEEFEGAFTFHLTNATTDDTGSQSYINCGSSGRFSGNSNNTEDAQQIYAFEVTDPSATTIVATKATSITSGKTYLLVGLKNSKYYALTDELYSGNSTNQRMVGTEVTITDETITYTGDADILWTFVNKNVATEKSFFSSFMGSMRYYGNTIDSDQLSERQIVQALMVYVYSDRVELKMKNYAQSGTINGITVNQELTPYVSYRTVTHSAEAVTATPTIESAGGVVNPASEVTVNVTAPEWHNLYYTINGENPTEASTKVENGQITFTADAEVEEYVVKVVAQEGIRLVSNVASVTYQVADTHGITVSATEGGSAQFAIDGDNVTLTATEPAEGYYFTGWSVGESADIVSTDNPYTTAIVENAAYKANYAKYTYTVTLTAGEGGTVNTIQNPVAYGETVELIATANTGYRFVNWSDNSTDNPYTITVTGDIELTANFEEVSIEEIYAGICKPTFTGRGNNTYVKAAQVYGKSIEIPSELLNNVQRGYVPTPIEVVAGSEFVLDLNFVKNFNDIRIYQIENEDTSNPAYTYGPYEGSWVESGNHPDPFEAMAADGITVNGTTASFPLTFSESLAVGELAVVRVAIGDVTTPCASVSGEGGYLDFLFVMAEPSTSRTISAEANPVEGGTVTGAATAEGPITLTATPNNGYEFVNWTVGEEVVGTTLSITDNSSESKTYVANFNKLKEKAPQLTVVTATTNFGTWETNSIDNIKDNNYGTKFWSNGNQEVGKYLQVDLGNIYNVEDIVLYFAGGDQPDGAVVEVSETGVDDSWTEVASFVNGDIKSGTENETAVNTYSCSTESNARYVRMRITTAKSAWFQLLEFKVYGTTLPRTVTVTSSNITMGVVYITSPAPEGTGTGTGSQSPSVTTNEDVTVLAEATEGNRFVNWTIAGNQVGEAGNTTYTYTDDESVTITANFEKIPEIFAVSVAVNDRTMGKATMSVTESSVEEGTSVTFTATPYTGYEFVNWTNAAGSSVSTSATYTTTIDANTALTANFQVSTSLGGRWFRLKEVTSGNYLNAANYTAHTSGSTGGVNAIALNSSSDDQIFLFEKSGSSYRLKTKSGYNIVCQQWNVDALTSEGTLLTITETTYNSQPAIKINITSPTSDQRNGAFKIQNVGGTYYPFCDANNSDIATWVLEEVFISDINVTKTTATAEATINVTTDAPATITIGTQTYTTTAENLTIEIPISATSNQDIEIEAVGGKVTSVECSDNIAPTEIPSTVTELALRNVNATEVAIDAPQLEKITVVSEAPAYDAAGEEYDYNVATLSAISDLSMGVQVVVEKEINTPQPIEGKGTPSYFNFLSMPFAFNTADIKYWDGDSWESAVAETHVRIMTYNSEIRAQGKYGETWEKVASGASIDIAANQGFVIVGNNNYGGADAGYKMKLQFTSAEAAYSQNGSTKSVETVENNNGGTSHMFDENWNHIGAPYLTKVTAPEGKTIYTHTGYNYEEYVPAEDTKIINPYQGFMLQSVGAISLEPETSVAALSLTKASESVYAKAYISVDESAPAKIILSDESSENFVVNEDAWYMAPTANVISANYFVVDGMEARVTVQPEATELPMTVYAGAGTTHTISLTRMDGERNVYLKDAVTDEIVCLNDEDYTFTSAAKTTIANRFTISMTDPTGIIENAMSEGTIKVVVAGDYIKMYGTVEGTDITLYNANGMVITNAVAEDGVTTVSTSATGVIVIKADNTVVKVVK